MMYQSMRFLLYSICVIILLTTTGCILVPGGRDQDHKPDLEHPANGDHDGGQGNHEGDHVAAPDAHH